MNKLFTLLLASMMAMVGYSQDLPDYTMYDFVYIKPNFEKIQELKKAMAEHNRMYHAESPYRAQVWAVQSGSYTGWWAWIMGSCTFTELDGRPDDKAHSKDWSESVMPFVAEVAERNFWKRDAETTYIPDINFTGKEIWTVYEIKPFETYRFTDLLKKVKQVYEEKNYAKTLEVYHAQLDMKNMGDILIATTFENWATFDTDPRFSDDYEAVFGEGSWSKFLEEYRDVVISVEDQVAIRIPELTGGTEENKNY